MPVASITEATRAMTDVFRTAWVASAYSAIPIYYDDVKKGPVNTAYVRFSIQHNENPSVSIGGQSKRFRQYGVITVQIFTPSGEGRATNNLMTEVALRAFMGVNTGADAITFRDPTPREVGESGNFWQNNVLVEFDYDRVV